MCIARLEHHRDEADRMRFRSQIRKSQNNALSRPHDVKGSSVATRSAGLAIVALRREMN